MPIKPEEANKLSESENENIKAAENYVDNYLKNYYVGKQITIPIKQFCLTERSKKKIIEDYELVGWFVSLEVRGNNENIVLSEKKFPEIEYSGKIYGRTRYDLF